MRAIVLILLAAFSASAATIVSDERFVSTTSSIWACNWGCQGGTGAPPYTPSWKMSAISESDDFKALVVSPLYYTAPTQTWAAQTSFVSAERMEASGYSRVEARTCGAGYSSGGCGVKGLIESVFKVVFEVTSATPYTLATMGTGLIYLERGGALEREERPSQTLGWITTTGILDPGIYSLYAGQSNSFSLVNGEALHTPYGSAWDEYHVLLTLGDRPQLTRAPAQEVPEPPTFALTGVALLLGTPLLLRTVRPPKRVELHQKWGKWTNLSIWLSI